MPGLPDYCVYLCPIIIFIRYLTWSNRALQELATKLNAEELAELNTHLSRVSQASEGLRRVSVAVDRQARANAMRRASHAGRRSVELPHTASSMKGDDKV